MSIIIQNVSKAFGDVDVLKDLSFEVKTGELVALLGPSGSGKTTLLRSIAGLEVIDSGNILFHGDDTKDKTIQERQVGFVFQHYALFKHMTVFENVAFGLRVRDKKSRPSEAEIERKVHELLQLVQLDYLGKRYPSQLSGGQRQRIALARALAIEPQLLLLDEPFGALDAKVRKELRKWLRRLHDELHITSVFVTHDVEEALEVADRIVIMNEGRIEQIGTPEEVYHHCANAFVYQFIGNVNLFHGRVEDKVAHFGNVSVSLPETSEQETKDTVFYVRPHDLDIHHSAPDSTAFKAKIDHVHLAGPVVRVDLTSEWGDPVHVEITQDYYLSMTFQKGMDVFVSPKDGRLFMQDYSI